MPDENTIERVIYPLSDASRKERRALLLMTVVLAAAIFGGVRPTRVEQLGLVFDSGQSSLLVSLLLIVQGYFLLAYYFYSGSERTAWERSNHAFQNELLVSLMGKVWQLHRVLEAGAMVDAFAIRDEIVAHLVALQSFIDPKTYLGLSNALHHPNLFSFVNESDRARYNPSDAHLRLSRTRLLIRKEPSGEATSYAQAVCALANGFSYLRVAARHISIRWRFDLSLGQRLRYRRVFHRRCESALTALFAEKDPVLLQASEQFFQIERLVFISRLFLEVKEAFPLFLNRDADWNLALAVDELNAAGAWFNAERRFTADSDAYLLDQVTRLSEWEVAELSSAVEQLLRLERPLAARLSQLSRRAWFDFQMPLYFASILAIASSVDLVQAALQQSY